jgi:uridine kinase
VGIKPYVIGIAGPSCAGKSELGRRLAARLAGRAEQISLDSYYRDLADMDPAARQTHNFDHPDAMDRGLLARQLAALARGQSVEAPVYDFATHTRAGEVRAVLPAPVVIVEGLFVLAWDEVRESIDLAVFVDAPHDVCLARRLARDVCERGRTERSVREQYEKTVRPMYDHWVRPTRRHADLIVDGTGAPGDAVSTVLNRVPAGLREP